MQTFENVVLETFLCKNQLSDRFKQEPGKCKHSKMYSKHIIMQKPVKWFTIKQEQDKWFCILTNPLISLQKSTLILFFSTDLKSIDEEDRQTDAIIEKTATKSEKCITLRLLYPNSSK